VRALRGARFAVGVTDLVVPAFVGLDSRARAVARVLGARHLAQALLAGSRPTRAVLALGAEVDAAHAASMVLLGVADERRRTTAWINAAVAASFAVAGVAAARRTSRRPPPTSSGWAASRDRWADRLAGGLVPGYRS
jgi:hypothetical protein